MQDYQGPLNRFSLARLTEYCRCPDYLLESSWCNRRSFLNLLTRVLSRCRSSKTTHPDGTQKYTATSELHEEIEEHLSQDLISKVLSFSRSVLELNGERCSM